MCDDCATAQYKYSSSWTDYYDCKLTSANLLLNYYTWAQDTHSNFRGREIDASYDCAEGAFMQTDEYCESSCNQAIADGFEQLTGVGVEYAESETGQL